MFQKEKANKIKSTVIKVALPEDSLKNKCSKIYIFRNDDKKYRGNLIITVKCYTYTDNFYLPTNTYAYLFIYIYICDDELQQNNHAMRLNCVSLQLSVT